MEKRLIEICRDLCSITAPSGYEDSAITYLEQCIEKKSVFSIVKDRIGNLICSYHGTNSNEKTCFMAHVDSAGIFCSSPDNNDKKSWGSLSTWKKEKIDQQLFKFLSGAEAIVNFNDKTLIQNGNIRINQGDFGAFKPSFSINEAKITGTFLDNRIICACLLYFIERLVDSDKSFTFIFTVQEEIGNKGAKAIAHNFHFDKVYVLDTTVGNLDKSSSSIPILGQGACIKYCDGSGLCSKRLNKFLLEVANRNNVLIQKELIDFAGSDIVAFSEHGYDCDFTGISIPCYNMHSPNEIMSTYDVDCFLNLFRLLLEEYYGAKFAY